MKDGEDCKATSSLDTTLCMRVPFLRCVECILLKRRPSGLSEVETSGEFSLVRPWELEEGLDTHFKGCGSWHHVQAFNSVHPPELHL